MSHPARTLPPPAAGETRPDNGQTFAIGDLAAELGITTRAIRFYEAKGLLSPQRRGNARCYSRRDRARLMLILRGKNLGFSLDDIKQYLELYDADPLQLTQVKLLEQKVNAHMAELERKRADLDRTLAELADIRAQIAAHLADTGRD
ncbi:MAG TPA: MerR family DNA-binding transcriptional regulator [Hyphomicrobiaceae bacterium]|nr:MerR family DNA-binding transcriptional regulator [Hyphomicrobiaceae bacterium]